MLVDSRAISSGATLRARLCIIGAGAAGISIARKFIGQKTEVLLLEGGGFDRMAASQDLYEGEMLSTQGRRNSRYLVNSRLRYFGGTTNHWGGWCRPLDPIDFEKRDWVPESGWPIRPSDLAPWYPEAAEVLQIPPFPRDPTTWEAANRRPISIGSNRRVESAVYLYSPPTRFGRVYRNELIDAPNVRVVLDANVTNLHSGAGLRNVDHLDVATPSGRRYTVEADFFILATGGIENPRLLLASDHEQPTGLGNGHDVVGRYFCDHPHTGNGNAGELLVTDRELLAEHPARLTMYTEVRRDEVLDCRTCALFQLSEETLRSEELLQYGVQIRDPKRVEIDALGDAVGRTVSNLQSPGVSTPGYQGYSVFIRTEQSPNPENRVSLSQERDALGMRRVRLNWQFTERELRTHRRGAQILAQELGISDFGRVRQEMDLSTVDKAFEHTEGGAHHLGTTRMHEDPKRGVVDANCRVHGIDNLYIAGSSVFTTSGLSNPTFTIVSLALRLAAHVKQRIDRGPTP